MKQHSTENPYSLQCSPGVPPRLNWQGLAPVDWSGLPRLRTRTEELIRFKDKWEREWQTLRLPQHVPRIPVIANKEHVNHVLKGMRGTCKLPLDEFVDWRGITRDAEDALAEYYLLARKYCMKMRGTGAKTPSVGQGFFPNTKVNGHPQRELERAADYLGARVARENPRAIGPKAKPWRGLTQSDFTWLERKYPGDYWKTFIDSDFMRWHLNKRAEWAYDVASVRIRKSQRKDHPRPSWNVVMYQEWVNKEIKSMASKEAIDTPIDQAMIDEEARLEAYFEANLLSLEGD